MLSLILLKLTLQAVLADLPHDGGSAIAYLLIALFVGFIWAGSRGGSEDPPFRS